MRRETRHCLWLSGFCLLTALLTRWSPGACAWYALRVFPQVRAAFCALNDGLPGWEKPVAAALCLHALAPCLRRGNRRRLPARLARLGLTLCGAFFVLWAPLYGLPGGTRAEPQPAFLQASALGEQLNRSADCFPQDASALEEWVERAHSAAQEAFACRLSRPATSGERTLYNRLGIAGFHNPLTGQTFVNSGDRPLLLPFTICHELAHQAGTAREDQANLVAWRLCGELGGAFEASSALHLLLLAAQEVTDAERQALMAQMNEAVRREFVASNGSHSVVPSSLQRAFERLSDRFRRLLGAGNYQEALRLIPPRP